jgi:hypothetical protein
MCRKGSCRCRAGGFGARGWWRWLGRKFRETVGLMSSFFVSLDSAVVGAEKDGISTVEVGGGQGRLDESNVSGGRGDTEVVNVEVGTFWSSTDSGGGQWYPSVIAADTSEKAFALGVGIDFGDVTPLDFSYIQNQHGQDDAQKNDRHESLFGVRRGPAPRPSHHSRGSSEFHQIPFFRLSA